MPLLESKFVHRDGVDLVDLCLCDPLAFDPKIDSALWFAPPSPRENFYFLLAHLATPRWLL